LGSPPWTYSPPGYLSVEIAPGEVLARVFDHEHAAAVGYSPLDFNHTVPARGTGGRFDPTKRDRFGYLYFGQTRSGALVPIHERLLQRVLFDADRGAFVVTRAEVETKSLIYFTPVRPLTLVDISDARGLSRFGATTDLVTSRDYQRTRPWARYIRARAPDAQGLAWTSRAVGDGMAIVVFEDRAGHAPQFAPLGPPLRLLDGGLGILIAVLAECQAVLTP